MKRRKWLAAIGIIAVLAAAFYWGGSDQPAKGSDAAVSAPAVAEVGDATSDAEADSTASEQQLAAQAPAAGQAAAGETLKYDPPNKAAEAKPQQSAEPSETKQPTKPAEVVDSQTKGAANTGSSSTGKPASDKPETTKPSSSKPSSTKPATDESSKDEAMNSKPAVTTKPPTQSAASGTNTGKKDPYLTDKVPAGKPAPVEWQDAKVDKKQPLTVTLSVSCKTILDHLDDFDPDKLEVLPEDGIIFAEQKVTFYEGETVFDVLLREMKKHKIHMEFEMTPLYNSNYIEGIHNIYEFDCGELSGWMYRVNGWFPNYGASRYKLKDGDVIEWLYTCDLGRDIGGGQTAAGGKR
ncbi:DUF4430 domain-containing protein [Paenibacillus albus]|uniref:DUF4430 domain-containing protein n=2 Tax=Paenibacillus albus TaxID=2495582 RepID=A0A3Q8XBB1_9BACL|nr:DUF4430 domain-containing protein [Paenibacillus albus]